MKTIIPINKIAVFLVVIALLMSIFNIQTGLAEDDLQEDQSVDEQSAEEPINITVVDGRECIDGEVLVSFTDSHTQSSIGYTLESFGSNIKDEPTGDVALTLVPQGSTVEEFIEELKEHDNIEYVQPNYIYRLDKAVNDPAAQLPNPDQWHLDTINVYKAWDITMGSSDIRVAVLDTGIDLSHPDLTERVYMHTDTVDNDGSADDDNGHGTHVAGIIAANDNNGIGVVGVAPNTSLIIADVFGWHDVETSPGVFSEEFFAQTSDIIQGIDFAVTNGADVLNMSFGDYDDNEALHQALSSAAASGIICVASAGNDGVTDDHFPSDYSECISVIWTDRYDNRDPNSNYGPQKIISAPGGSSAGVDGDGILSTCWLNDDPDWQYAYASGTSMASPMVAGVAALILSVNPDLTTQKAKDILLNSAVDLGTLGRDDEYGYGRVDAKAAVQAACETLYFPVEGMELSRISVTLMSGTTVTVSAEFTPENATNQNITWTSSNESIATVDDGIITGVSEGTAVITSTTEEGGFSDTCHVMVLPFSDFNAFLDLGFTPLDMVLDPDREVAYLTAVDGYKLYRIDLNTGGIANIDFPYKAERLTVKNGKIYITLPQHEHQFYMDGSKGYGSVGVVDTDSFTIDRIFDVEPDPYDIEADSEGRVYIAPGTGQHSYISVYDSNTGDSFDTSGSIYHRPLLDFHTEYNKLYAISQNLSPRDIDAFEITEGYITAAYESPYHGDYSMSPDISISPDGQYIFNGTGNIFACEPTHDGDLLYNGTLESMFTSICYDLDNNRFFTLYENELKVLNYNNREELSTYISEDNISKIFHDGTQIIMLQTTGEGIFYVDKADPASKNVTLKTLNVSAGSLTPSFNSETEEYYLIIDENTSEVTLTGETSDVNSSIYIDGVLAADKTIAIAKGEALTVSIDVKSEDNMVHKTYTVRIYRETGKRELNIYSEFFTRTEYKTSSNNNSMFMLGEEQDYIYIYDSMTGDFSLLYVENVKKILGIEQNILYVSIYDENNRWRVDIIDLETLSVRDIIQGDVEYNEIVTDDEYIFAYNYNTVDIYSKATLDRLSSTYFSNLQSLVKNEFNQQIYIAAYSNLYSYKVVGGQLEQIKCFIQNRTNRDMWVMPDGKHLLLDNGTAFSCSSILDEDLVYMTDLGGQDSYTVDVNTNEIYAVFEREIEVYDASDFSFKRSFSEPDIIGMLDNAGGNLIFTYTPNYNTYYIKSIFAGSMLKDLKLDGDAFSEFYPACLYMDRGVVPNSKTSVNIAPQAIKSNAVITGDIGDQPLFVGENIYEIVVTDPDSSISQTYTLRFYRRDSDPPEETYNAFTDLGFIPGDAALDPDRPVMYMTEHDGYSLYRIDIITGEITSKEFDIKAESIMVRNGKIYVTLLRHNHNPHIHDEEEYGSVAVIDTQTFIIERIFGTITDTYDIEADERGRVYLASGSGQWTELTVYNADNGRYIDQSGIRQRSYLEVNLPMNKVYSLNTDLSPRDMEAYEISEDGIGDNYDSPYHGDYSMYTYFKVSPDGYYIFNGGGNIFICRATQTGDMTYDSSLEQIFYSMCFDLANDEFYTVYDNVRTTYSYSTRIVKDTYTSYHQYVDIYHDGEDLISLMFNSSGKYYLRFEEDTITTVSLNKSNLNLYVGDAEQLTAEVMPENSPDKTVIWTSSDESVALVDANGIVSAISEGTATITAASQHSGFTDVCTVSVSKPPVSVTGVNLDKSHILLTLGDAETLAATVLPSDATNKTVSWYSSDIGTASVSDGVVTAVSYGTATITVKTDDGNYTDTCTVQINKPVTGIELSDETIEMLVGENRILTATINPSDATNKNVTWSSSNEGVALVDGNGNVSAVSSGTAIITSTTQDGGFTDTCTVTVKSANIESSVYTIGLDATINGIKIDTTIAQLIANLNNDSANIKIFDQNGNEVTGGILCTGMTVKLIISDSVRDELTIIILGDTNGDGIISITDYTLARLDILGLKALGQTAAVAADINGDGVVSITDYTLMRLDILGLKNIH